jgi:hypothetical protein
MSKMMSLSARREMVFGVNDAYGRASKSEKTKILDGFVAATGYERKYAILLLSKKIQLPQDERKRKRSGGQIYDEQFVHVLTVVWNTANQICSKRFVPFIPNLVSAMERYGHLRTFADWDDVSPGFFEVDLVAHCGGDPSGAFLNTLTMVDVASGWLECMPLIKKSASNVIGGISVTKKLMPFDLKGIDTDGGSELINYELLDYCESNQITFTRARIHKENDQAFVEKKNDSIVRRLVGYNRYQGMKAWEALASFYQVLRQYINFFQPSLKWLNKTREEGRVSKQYDVALTSHQRLIKITSVSPATIEKLEAEYLTLYPVKLMAELKRLQHNLFQFAWYNNVQADVVTEEAQANDETAQETILDASTKIDYFNYHKP